MSNASSSLPLKAAGNRPDVTRASYLDAYSRINAVVIVGEALAYRHFRLLAKAIPTDGPLLEGLAAMELSHSRDFLGCGANLGVKPDTAFARELFEPLHALFQQARQRADLVGMVVIQCLIVECFAVAAYRQYLPVADPYAAPITERVMADEDEHLDYGETWLRPRLATVSGAVAAWCLQALPIVFGMLAPLRGDLISLGMDPSELTAEFSVLLQGAMERIGFSVTQSRQVLAQAASRLLAASSQQLATERA